MQGEKKVFILRLTKEKYHSSDLGTTKNFLEVRKVINIQPKKTEKKIAKLEGDVEDEVALTLPPRLRLFIFSLICADLKIYISTMREKKKKKQQWRLSNIRKLCLRLAASES